MTLGEVRAMPKRHPRPSITARSRGDEGLGYEVGYAKPPRHTRFKPGQSGNPKGHRRGSRNLKTIIEDALDETVTIREGARVRTLPKREALVRTLVNGALMKDAKSLQALLAIMRATGSIAEEPAPAPAQELSPEDETLIADFLRRHGGGS
jgi:Family of unknown function (DUF5681)